MVTSVVTKRVIFSASEESFRIADRELKAAFGRLSTIERMGPDVGVLSGPGLTMAEISSECLSRPVVMIKHLATEVARIPVATSPDSHALAGEAVKVLAAYPHASPISVQAWVSGHSTLGYGSSEVLRAVSSAMRADGYMPGRAGNEMVLSCCITPKAVLIGLNETRLALSDWPGGRIRLLRSDQQISRAEFKLEELFQTFPVDIPAKGVAVDYGAAPGGWTRILREKGLNVLAVDPGELDPRVARDRGVRHLRTTAGEFLRANRVKLDMAVNDMRMDPVLSCELMVATAPHLKHRATAIVTLKVGTQHVLDKVDHCLELLTAKYDVTAARQLHHNRSEITVLLRRKLDRR